MQDGPGLELFHADLAVGNYIQPQTLDPTGSVYNFGLWFNHSGQDTLCSFGSFNYGTIATLGVGHRDDQVTAVGLWTGSVPFNGVQSFLAPGALWIIGDNGKDPDVYMRNGSYFAELVSIEEVPLPGSLALVLAGLAACWLRWRRRYVC